MKPTQQRLEKIAAFVKERLEQTAKENPGPYVDPIYRWEHTLRVSQYGKQIAEGEGANVELAIAGCLLHDVAHFDPMENPYDHGRVGAMVSRPFLEEVGYSAEDVDEVCYAVAVHVGYDSANRLLTSVVTDADNVDRFGAYRILQWCAPNMADFPKLVEILRQRLERLEMYQQNNPLQTPTGRELFARQLDLQIPVFRALVAEWEMTKLP